MKPQHLVPLAILAVIIGLLSLLLPGGGSVASKAVPGVGGKLIPNFPLNDITKIRITSKQGELLVEKGETGWTLPSRNGYPANFDRVGTLLRRVWETKVVQTVQAGPSAFPRFELTKPSETPEGSTPGILLEFINAEGKVVTSLVLGKSTSAGAQSATPFGNSATGRFVLDSNQTTRVAVVSEPFSEADIAVRDWLAEDFIAVSKIREIAVTGATPEQTWTVRRDSEETPFTLVNPAPGEEVDPTKLSALNTSLSYARFEDVLKGDVPAEQSGLDKATQVAITTFEDFTYNISIGNPGENSTRYAKLAVTAAQPAQRIAPPEETPEEKKRLDEEFGAKQKILADKLTKEQKVGSWIYLVPDAQFTEFLKARKDFLSEKPTPTPEPTPSPTPAKKTKKKNS